MSDSSALGDRSLTNGPLRCMFVTERGEVWASTPEGWCWLREQFYETGWHWESGYDEPLSPVTPLLDLLGGTDVSRVVAEALTAVRKHIDHEISQRVPVAESVRGTDNTKGASE